MSIPQPCLDTIFNHARTHSAWLDKPVEEKVLRQLYDLAKMGPTSANCCPMRIVFVKTPHGKERLKPCLDAGNVEKTMKAPVTAIIAQDMTFYENMPKLFPHTDARSWYVGNQKLIETTAFRNSTLQGAYTIIAARSLGLDCGPMSGFDNQKLDIEFFRNTPIRSNFLINLGYGDASKLHPRNPRLEWGEVCQVV